MTLVQLLGSRFLGLCKRQLAIAEGKMLLPFEQRRNTVPGCFQSPKSRSLLQPLMLSKMLLASG